MDPALVSGQSSFPPPKPLPKKGHSSWKPGISTPLSRQSMESIERRLGLTWAREGPGQLLWPPSSGRSLAYTASLERQRQTLHHGTQPAQHCTASPLTPLLARKCPREQDWWGLGKGHCYPSAQGFSL